ncbi:MAG: DUF2946 domain-containing protein [Colwellia sp.]|nr:DUF2946 domain-containing protein [Colwellia sp.]
MRVNWLSLLLVISIVLQSFVAVADAEKPHQINSQHLQTEHVHDDDPESLNKSLSDSLSDSSGPEHNINDCHHCGHCQGSHTQWIVNKKIATTAPDFMVFNQYSYFNHLAKSFIEEVTRPPISLI